MRRKGKINAVGWIVAPKIYVSVLIQEPVNVTFGKRIFLDVKKLRISW